MVRLDFYCRFFNDLVRGMGMNKTFRFLLATMLLIGAPNIFAMSDAEIQEKFDSYEAKIQALEKKINASPASVNKKVVKGVKKNKKRLAKLKKYWMRRKSAFK